MNQIHKWLSISLFALPISLAVASVDPSTPGTMDAIQRDRLRFKLENLFNEQDLMIRNQRVDASDVTLQRKQFAALKVFERIPFNTDLPGLRRQLAATAERHQLQITAFQRLQLVGNPTRPIPRAVYSDEPRLRLGPDQIADTIPFKLVVRGQPKDIHAWIKSWSTQQLRITETASVSIRDSIRPLQGGRWEIRARAFRFKPIRFPELRARNPIALLPSWAATDPDRFARQEPMLWEFVQRIRRVAPRAKPLYRGRGELLLNDARMSFFLSKVAPR